ncbi:hypothetical protein HRI_005122000 [Hibiscus trionum]|uniref:DUF7722 domain-containing protein n=1 Tax=Hibiscus trionum TaxID=183268 RepID=A0A9W7MQW9_HIBTR|nr:hypothetical protein HRI_005122000 [Hibiscus trionum]
MALNWILHSACHVLGYQNQPNNLYYCSKNMACDQTRGGGVTQSSKVSSNCNPTSSRNAETQATSEFQMPLHYPRYTKADYETMEEWKVDVLLREYGLNVDGSLSNLDEKRAYAMGAFLWPDQY